MQSSIAYLLIGLGAGAFYAMLAAGVVVAFKGSGVINFAHGAMAMFVAFQFHYLRTKSRSSCRGSTSSPARSSRATSRSRSSSTPLAAR